jgi:hypothetical protein
LDKAPEPKFPGALPDNITHIQCFALYLEFRSLSCVARVV